MDGVKEVSTIFAVRNYFSLCPTWWNVLFSSVTFFLIGWSEHFSRCHGSYYKFFNVDSYYWTSYRNIWLGYMSHITVNIKKANKMKKCVFIFFTNYVNWTTENIRRNITRRVREKGQVIQAQEVRSRLQRNIETLQVTMTQRRVKKLRFR